MVALQVAAYRYHDLPRLAAYRYHMSQPNYHFQAHLALLHFEQVDMEDDDEIP
jgi:DICT domain-containing protein